jgi:hypothetical protein
MGTHEPQELLLDALRADLAQIGEERFRDEKFMTELYRALTNRAWSRAGAFGELSLSWKRAADLVDELRATVGRPPLALEASGGEGTLDRTVADAVAPLGWTSRPLDTSSHEPSHLEAGGTPDPHAEPEFSVALYRLDENDTPRAEEAIARLRAALPDARVDEPDATGVFAVHLRAPSFEEALHRVWDAIAAAGADDHVVFMEHPEIPEHWKTRASTAGEAGPS